MPPIDHNLKEKCKYIFDHFDMINYICGCLSLLYKFTIFLVFFNYPHTVGQSDYVHKFLIFLGKTVAHTFQKSN